MWPLGVKHYQMIKEISICDYVPPHCAIYIDVPAEEVHTKLKQSGKVGELFGKTTLACTCN